MSSAVVDYSRGLLLESIKVELRGSGDVLPALRRIATQAGIPYGKLYALKYRPGADVDGSVLLKLHLFHEDLCARQVERYRAARDATPSAGPISAALTRLAGAIAGSADGEG